MIDSALISILIHTALIVLIQILVAILVITMGIVVVIFIVIVVGNSSSGAVTHNKTAQTRSIRRVKVEAHYAIDRIA